MSELLRRIEETEGRARALEEQLADPAMAGRSSEYQGFARELGRLRRMLDAGARYRKLFADVEGARALLDEDDEELRQAARDELARLEPELEQVERQIRLLLVPPDPNDERNVIVEIRSGTGGEEAALFAGDLFRMYCRYAERRGWKVELLARSEGASGGMREAIASVLGAGVWSRLKYERGVHRVQRVPATESAGRIHTSTVTVAVLPEAEEVEIQIDPKELRIDVMRAGGPGGQSVNTTDSAVRITHKPSGLVVTMQDERSQLQNKARAMTVLRSRLMKLAEDEQAATQSAERRAQVGGGGRGEKIRTYNFKENRLTDHRIGFTIYRLQDVLAGDLDETIDALAADERARQLAGQT